MGGIIFYLLFIIYIFSGGNISQVQSTNNWYEISNLTHLYFMLSIVFSDFHHDCRVVTIHIFFKCNLKKCSSFVFTLSTVFSQISHVCGVFTIHIFLKMQPQNLLLIYKHIKKIKFQPQKMLLIVFYSFTQFETVIVFLILHP